MQTRGRGDRIAFAESFKDIYNFRLLYGSSVSFFPIKVLDSLHGVRGEGDNYYHMICLFFAILTMYRIVSYRIEFTSIEQKNMQR